VHKITEGIIERIYIHGDVSFFKDKCKETVNILENLYDILKLSNLSYIEENLANAPALRWWIYYNKVEKGDFKVTYRTVLLISKIAPLFYIQHEFEVENKDDEAMAPVLDGFDTQPYSKNQAQLEDKIVNLLKNSGYVKLTYTEMNEIIPYLCFPKDVDVFGLQVSVEDLLFNDIMNILEEN
jgi:hypothetical protein